MSIDVACEVCGDGLEIVREWTDRDGMHITVKPCDYCIEQAAKFVASGDDFPTLPGSLQRWGKNKRGQAKWVPTSGVVCIARRQCQKVAVAVKSVIKSMR